MAFLGDAVIDEVLTFYANTHDPTTEGNPAADADAPPTYRVYEEETGTPLLTGSMAKLDDSNTLGFYSEAITLSAANGFEVDKTYCIRKAATVNSVDGVEIDTFKMVVDVAVDGSNRVLAAVDATTSNGNTALTGSGLATAANLATASGHAESAATAATSADGKLPNLTANNLVPVDVKRINAVELTGDGDGTPMGAA